MAQRIYSTTVTNSGGTAGWVRASDGPQVQTGPPSDPSRGVNPEQFLGMAWSTCLNATVEAVLRDQGFGAAGVTGTEKAGATAEGRMPSADVPDVPRSRVTVQVSLVREPGGEYRFVPEATVSVEGLETAEVERVAAAAHARCPVSKLLTGRGEPVQVRAGVWDGDGAASGTSGGPASTLPVTESGSEDVQNVMGTVPDSGAADAQAAGPQGASR